jgi:hypothetical protein
LNSGSSTGTTTPSPTSIGHAAHNRRHVVNAGRETNQTPAETAAHYLQGVRDEILAHAINGIGKSRRRR